MKTKPHNYAMFTDAGGNAVHDLVVLATKNNEDWPTVYEWLCDLAEDEDCSEATDTAVRECVYDACGFKTAFYV